MNVEPVIQHIFLYYKTQLRWEMLFHFVPIFNMKFLVYFLLSFKKNTSSVKRWKMSAVIPCQGNSEVVILEAIALVFIKEEIDKVGPLNWFFCNCWITQTLAFLALWNFSLKRFSATLDFFLSHVVYTFLTILIKWILILRNVKF